MGVPMVRVGYVPSSDAVTDAAAWMRPSHRRGRPSGRRGQGSVAKDGPFRGTGTPMGRDGSPHASHRYIQPDDARARLCLINARGRLADPKIARLIQNHQSAGFARKRPGAHELAARPLNALWGGNTGSEVSPVRHPRGSLMIGGVLTSLDGTLPLHAPTDLVPHRGRASPLALSEAPQFTQDPREVGTGPSRTTAEALGQPALDAFTRRWALPIAHCPSIGWLRPRNHAGMAEQVKPRAAVGECDTRG